MTKIIAEIGSNFRNMDEAVLSVTRAKQAGADCVKFQHFTEMDLYGPSAPFERRVAIEPGVLAQRAQDVGIGFLCSVFSPEAVRWIDPYVFAHKIASAEMCHVDLLREVARTGKPILLSTGGHTLAEVQRALDVLGPAADRTTLLYCESAYPASCYMPEKLGLLMRETSCDGYGISDHTKDLYMTGWLAQHYDVAVIEKHVNLVDADGPDAPHSLDYDDFKAFCRYIKQRNIMVSDILSDAEAEMVTQHNRRLVASCDIPRGGVFCKGINFGIYRGQSENAHALSPFDWAKVQGRSAMRNLRAGEAICDGDFG